METAEVIRNAIYKGEWVVSIDLTDAYFHIPIHKKSQDFMWQGKRTSSGPFHSALLRPSRVLTSCERSKAHATKQGNAYTPVSR